ncbi:hypothetical protein M0804_012876 [Polistes exclamans]|nr:hypothetical protein M0804_012876 [Polistes exclamans]
MTHDLYSTGNHNYTEFSSSTWDRYRTQVLDGMGWDGMGWDGMGWDTLNATHANETRGADATTSIRIDRLH